MIATSSLLIGEALLSLYPILVRNVPIDLLTHTMVRLITAAIVCYPITSVNLIGRLSYHLVSVVYLIHIWSSYVGFRHLNVGVALTLFYTYPIINLLINTQSISSEIIYYFMVSFVGVTLIGMGVTQTNHGSSTLLLGVTSILIAALTESLIYTFYKREVDHNPFNMLFGMCFAGSIILLVVKGCMVGGGYSFPQSISNATIVQLMLANLILGVFGYLLRFYSIPETTTEWFSILSFAGIIFGYLYGWIFYRETITTPTIIGTLLIIYSAYRVKLLA